MLRHAEKREQRRPAPGAWIARALSTGVLVLGACSPSGAGTAEAGGPRAAELVVYAAASLRAALAELVPAYERAHGVAVVVNAGSSGDLGRQIRAADGADVFLSADEFEMDAVEAAGLLDEGSRVAPLSNQLVVIEPAGSGLPDAPRFPAPFTAEALAQPALTRLALADPRTVPAGRYARAWLEERGVWTEVERRVLPLLDVRAALAAVESGAAEAGIVYRTDAARSKRVRVVHAVPLDEGPRIVYAFAALRDRPAGTEARGFLAYLRSPEARAVFERLGFVVLDPDPHPHPTAREPRPSGTNPPR